VRSQNITEFNELLNGRVFIIFRGRFPKYVLKHNPCVHIEKAFFQLRVTFERLCIPGSPFPELSEWVVVNLLEMLDKLILL
jgi:hypothetical protein